MTVATGVGAGQTSKADRGHALNWVRTIGNSEWSEAGDKALAEALAQAFAAVRAEERQACAAECDNEAREWGGGDAFQVATTCGKRIRARGSVATGAGSHEEHVKLYMEMHRLYGKPLTPKEKKAVKAHIEAHRKGIEDRG